MAAKTTTKRRRSGTYHHGNLPSALLDVAKQLIAERGLEGFTLREVARRVGVTHVAAYRHYPDKRSLLAAVATHGFGRLRARMEAARQKTPPGLEPRLRALLGAYLQFCWAEPALTEVMFGPRLSARGEFPELDEAVTKSLGLIEETIGAFAPGPVLRERPPRHLGIALWTFVHGFSMLSHDKRAYPNARRAAAAFDDMLTPTLAGMFGTARPSRRTKPSTRR